MTLRAVPEVAIVRRFQADKNFSAPESPGGELIFTCLAQADQFATVLGEAMDFGDGLATQAEFNGFQNPTVVIAYDSGRFKVQVDASSVEDPKPVRSPAEEYEAELQAAFNEGLAETDYNLDGISE